MESAPLKLEDILNLHTPEERMDYTLSPGGEWLAITVKRHVPHRTGDGWFNHTNVSIDALGCYVLLVNTQTGHQKAPFLNDSTSWSPRWSPDGKYLAVYYQRSSEACLALWAKELDSWHIVDDLHIRTLFSYESPAWLPDNSGVIVKQVPKDHHPKNNQLRAASPKPDVTVFSNHGRAETHQEALSLFDEIGRLALYDIKSQTFHQLGKEAWAFRHFQVSPDASSIAFERLNGFSEFNENCLFDLMMLSLGSGKTHVLDRNIPESSGGAFAWSPDSRFIAYMSLPFGKARQLLVVDVSNPQSTPRKLSQGQLGVHCSSMDWSPLWSPSGDFLYVLSDGIHRFSLSSGEHNHLRPDLPHRIGVWVQPSATNLLHTCHEGSVCLTAMNPHTKECAVVRMWLNSGKHEVLAQGGWLLGGGTYLTTSSEDGRKLFLTQFDHTTTGRIVRLDLHERPTRVTRLFDYSSGINAEQYALPTMLKYEVGRASEEARQERQAIAWIPASGMKPFAALVYFYPGMRISNCLHLFGGLGVDYMNAHLIASQGYAVIMPDCILNGPNQMEQLSAEVLPAVEAAAAQGLIDPQRVGVFGHSYGAWGVLGLLANTRRFRAGVAVAPTVNLLSAYAAIDNLGGMRTGLFENGQFGCGGSPWECLPAYLDNSPLLSLSRVETPVMIAAGTGDDREAFEARQAFGALKRLGRRVELRLYTGEDHDPMMWSPGNLGDLHKNVMRWFDEHIKCEQPHAADGD